MELTRGSIANNLITLLLAVIIITLQSKAHSHEFILQNLEGVQKGVTVKGVHQLRQYLQKYGYLEYDENQVGNDEFDDAVVSAVKLYQEFYSLKPTGKLDSDTVIQMAKPRCGVPDIIHGKSRADIKPQYTFTGGTPKWPPSKMNLLYTFSSYGVHEFDLQVLSPIFASAFGKWASVTNFTFDEVPNSVAADIVISFWIGEHGDGLPFDGPYGYLAHATGPPVGRCHFDAEEHWSTTQPTRTEIDMESVAVHEIGHLLGLGHSNVRDAVMFAVTDAGVTKRELSQDDILGIHHLYGFSLATSNKIE